MFILKLQKFLNGGADLCRIAKDCQRVAFIAFREASIGSEHGFTLNDVAFRDVLSEFLRSDVVLMSSP